MSNKRDPKLKKHTTKKESSEPAREARQRPGCCFELRRAKRAGAQTGIRVLGNKKVLDPECGARRFKKMPLAPGSLGKIFLLEAGGVGHFLSA